MSQIFESVLSTKGQQVTPDKSLSKVLVVDDDADMRLYLAMIIGSTWEDAEVVEFDPLSQSIEEIGEWADYDVLILDYLLGESDTDRTGLDWLRRYARTPGYPQTVFVSAYGNEDVIQEALQLGALCFVAKGEDFAGRLVDAINALPGTGDDASASQWQLPEDIHPELGISEEELNQQAEVELATPEETESLCGFLVMKVDQTTTMEPVDCYAVMSQLAEQVPRWIEQDGAKTDSCKRADDQLQLCISELLGDVHLEMIAQSLCSQVKKAGFELRGARIEGSLSMGVVAERPDIAARQQDKLLASASRALEQAIAEGGDRFVLQTIEATRGRSADPEEPAATADAMVKQPGSFNVTEMIRSRKLGIQFQTILSSGSKTAAPFFLAVPRIELKEEETLDTDQETRLLKAIHDNLDMDRLAVIQAQMLLQAQTTARTSRVLIELSSHSVTSPVFWLWLIKRLRGSVDGLRLVFCISMRDINHSRLAKNALLEASYHCKFRIGLTGMVDIYKPENLPDILPIRLVMADMSGEFTINRCEQTVKLGAYSHQKNMEYVLRGVDSGEKLVCAYASKADMMHGLLTSEFSEMSMKPLDASFGGGRDRVLWFDSRNPRRHALRLAKIRRPEDAAS